MTSHVAGLFANAAIGTEYILLTAIAAVAIAGIVTGTLYRVGAAIAACFVTVIAICVIGASEGWSFWEIILASFGLITALQLGYLLGVALAHSGIRARNDVAQGWRRVGVMDEDARHKPPEG